MTETREALPPTFPDTECAGWQTPDFTVRSASVRGVGRRFHREPRQECARVAVHEESGAVAFAVADGVSGAAEAESGASQACRAAIERMLFLMAAGREVLDFEDVAHHVAHHATDRHATALVAGVIRPGSGPNGPHLQVCRIGGSGVWLLDRATGSYHALFGTKKDAIEQVQEHLTAAEVLLVGTDGFGGPLGDGHGRVGALFARHLAVPPSPQRLAHALGFSSETSDDDRTLVALWHGSASGTPSAGVGVGVGVGSSGG